MSDGAYTLGMTHFSPYHHQMQDVLHLGSHTIPLNARSFFQVKRDFLNFRLRSFIKILNERYENLLGYLLSLMQNALHLVENGLSLSK